MLLHIENLLDAAAIARMRAKLDGAEWIDGRETVGPQGAQVQVVYHMKALVVVAPPKAQPDVSVVSVKQVPFQPPAVKQGAPLPPTVPGLEITMKNVGRRHAMMSAFKWVIDGKDTAGKPQRIVVPEEQLSQAIGSGYVAGGGGIRKFTFPVVKPFGNAPITVKFAK